MNELFEDAGRDISKIKNEIKELEEAMTDADLSTVATLEQHMDAYDRLKGTIVGQNRYKLK